MSKFNEKDIVIMKTTHTNFYGKKTHIERKVEILEVQDLLKEYPDYPVQHYLVKEPEDDMEFSFSVIEDDLYEIE